MAIKKQTIAGFDVDQSAVRAVKATLVREDGDVTYDLDGIECQRGPFATESDLADAIRDVAKSLSVSMRTTAVTCLWGKDLHVAQIDFRRLPDAEMRSGLRFELRKSIPFDIASAVIEYQVLPASQQADKVPVMVAVAGNQLLNSHLALFAKANLAPAVVETLPVACANMLSVINKGGTPGAGTANVAIHISHSATVMVMDGEGVPFLTRTIYFEAMEVFRAKSATLSEQERRLRAEMFLDEISRTLAYYESTYKVSQFGSFHITGEYAAAPGIKEFVAKGIGLSPCANNLWDKMGWNGGKDAAACEIAAALTLRDG